MMDDAEKRKGKKDGIAIPSSTANNGEYSQGK